MQLSRRRFVAGAASLLILAGCNRSRQVRNQVNRVISVTPNTTEAMFALGAGHKLVGRSRYCDFPPEVTKIDVVGGYVDPSLEKILSLQPDLVIGARGPANRAFVDTLQSRGIKCFFPPTESVDQVLQMLIDLGQLVDAQPTAQKVTANIKSHLSTIGRRYQNKPKPKVLLVFGQAPVIVAGPGSFPNEMLTLAGCENAVKQGTTYPTVSFETLLQLNIEVVVDATMAGASTHIPIGADRPGWNLVPAVKQGRVVRIDDDRILRPGPRIAEGVEVIAKVVHGIEGSVKRDP